MAAVGTAVKESLIGSTREPQLSTQTRATFDRHAQRDNETGELYITQDGFINAIAPEDEDYVSSCAVIPTPAPSIAAQRRWCPFPYRRVSDV